MPMDVTSPVVAPVIAPSSGASIHDSSSSANSRATFLASKSPPANRKIATPLGRYSRHCIPVNVSQNLVSPAVASMAPGQVIPLSLRRERRQQRDRTSSPPPSSSSTSRSRSRSPSTAAGGRRIRRRLCHRRANTSAVTSALPCSSSSPSPCPSSTPSPCISVPAAGSASPCPSRYVRSATAFPASSVQSCPFSLATADHGAAGQYRRPASPLSRDSSPLMPSRCGTVPPLVLEAAHSPVNGPIAEHVDSVEDAIGLFQRLEAIQGLDKGSSQPGSPIAEREEENLQPPPVDLNEADLISNVRTYPAIPTTPLHNFQILTDSPFQPTVGVPRRRVAPEEAQGACRMAPAIQHYVHPLTVAISSHC
ncbi:hypothetical protein K450DRAFT_201455 [Umbelopsis ramanniana AG]|uniref:Uncharacterized protein n=1 Tax=Umbelopsis ramanniana AG TaxID=1314678 RepID=A0AAD5E493_UMBRA|nr:uncharacterized protein K450DRAFT_201455 [Umbelopsis ramanniana AG]KAI8577086.1 hypothetical protein K450DRAFT_201455 [Umbelopsis ramanniana AG]